MPTSQTTATEAFALHGDVANALDYHLSALLALVMGTAYKARPMHAAVSYNVSAFYCLRKVGQVRAPPGGGCSCSGDSGSVRRG